jgi:hypothetical protein
MSVGSNSYIQPYGATQYESNYDCSSNAFCSNGYEQEVRRPMPKPLQGSIMLDFNDFYWLMKLKISYQRKSVSQVMIKQSEILAKKSIKKPIYSDSNVQVEDRQESVQCLFWPYEPGRFYKSKADVIYQRPKERHSSPQRRLDYYLGKKSPRKH